ncbi:MAG: hypothetical protein OXQ29_12335, partial [Rhodospirillaceae bacterium]|nr:hypothetical protein [Rhodospirillaceae bacterium]
MNGARSTFMRKGYLLTALAAAVLLAASPGTALAQATGGKVSVSGPAMNTVAEGASATYTVTLNGFIPATTAAAPLTMELATPSPDTTDAGTAGDAEDISGNSDLSCIINVPAGPTEATADPAAFSGSCSIRVDTTTDDDAEDEKFTLAFTTPVGGLVVSAEAGAAAIALAEADRPGTLTIDDAQTQTYTLAVNAGQTPVEGGTTALTLRAVPAHEDDNITLVFHLSDAVNYKWDDDDFADGTVDAPANIVIGQGTANSDDVWIQAPMNDMNREVDTVSLTAYSGTAGNSEEQASVSVAFADLHTLPGDGAVTAMVVDMAGMEVMDPTITEGGDAVDLVISVDRGMGATATTLEALKVTVEGADPGQATDYKVSATEVDLAMVMEAAGAQKAAAIKLSATGPDDDVGDETLTLNLTLTGDDANGPGSSTGTFSITIVDDTTKQIAPKATDVAYPAIEAAIAAGAGDDGLNPGEMVEIMTSDLFDVADDYTASYGVSVNSDAVSASASGSTVTINALKKGMAEVTITGSASNGSGLMPSQTVSNVASLTFPVEVVDKELMITLEMPDNVMDGNVVEGMSYEIGVMANRMVTEAEGSVEVMIMGDRSASDARAGEDYTVGNATIMAGSDSAMAMLDVMEDNMPDAGTNDNMGEALVLYGTYGDGMETNDLMLTIWDSAVPALPLIAQILLAMFLALG